MESGLFQIQGTGQMFPGWLGCCESFLVPSRDLFQGQRLSCDLRGFKLAIWLADKKTKSEQILFQLGLSDSWPCHTSCRSILVGVWLEQEELRKFPRSLPCSQKAQGPSFGEHSAAGSHALPHIPPHKVSSKMLLATGTSFLMSLFPPGPNDRDRWISTCEASWLFLVTLSSYHSWDLPMLSLTNKWTIIIFATWTFVWIYPCTWQVFQPSNMNDGILTLGQGEEWGMAASLSSISIWEKGKLAHAHFCILVFQLYCPIPHQMDIQH